MKAMIFAAGLGTRLRPLTDTMPKALVPVAGQPLLHHVARKLIDAGCDGLVINAHHFADQIVKYVADANGFGVRTAISREDGLLLETGGGIRHAKGLLEGEGRFLVHNVDILSNLDVTAFMSQVRGDTLATLHVSERKSSRYLLFDKQMRLVGWTDTRTGEVKSPWPDLDLSSCRRMAFSGIHCISDNIFEVMEEMGMPERFPIMDFYLKVAAQYQIYGVEQPGFRMMDVGKVDTLAEAAQFLDDLH